MELFNYNFGNKIINYIDISKKQKNYLVKYAKNKKEVLNNQKEFFEKIGIKEFFGNRVILSCSFKATTSIVNNKKQSEYLGRNPNKSDGIITQKKDLPLVTFYGDCPQLFVAGEKTIGIVHATRDTLDKFILQKFFKKFTKYEKLKNVKIGFSPYIYKNNFKHTNLNLKRKIEWRKNGSIIEKNNAFYLDLKKMILLDLKKIGIKKNNIFDINKNTYSMAKQSVKNKGKSVSHRYSLKSGLEDARSIMIIMLK